MVFTQAEDGSTVASGSSDEYKLTCSGRLRMALERLVTRDEQLSMDSSGIASNSAATHDVAKQDRLGWVDNAKGIGISLVVFGHVLRGLATSHLIEWSPLATFVDSWLYSFHMPLFFVLSGLFLLPSSAKPFATLVSDKVRTLAYPYFLWSAITLLLKSSLGTLPNQPRDLSELPEILFFPIEQYWFLYALFLLSITTGLLLKQRCGPALLLSLAVLVYPGVTPESGWWIMDLARSYAIYLVLGVGVAMVWPLRGLEETGRWVLILLVAAGLGAAAVLVGSGLSQWSIFRPLTALSGTAGMIALALLFKGSAGLQTLGNYALPIYVAHTFASGGTRIALAQLLHIHSPAWHLVLGTVVGLYAPLALALACERLGIRFAFTLPAARQIGAPVL